MFLLSQDERIILRTFCCISVRKFLENEIVLIYTCFADVFVQLPAIVFILSKTEFLYTLMFF